MTDTIAMDADRIRQRRADQDNNIFGRLNSAATASRKQFQKLVQPSGGISIVEWRTLWDLVEAGPMTVRDFAAIQRADHSLFSRALPTMQEKGFVRMHRDPQDGRQTIVTLTQEGHAAFKAAAPTMARRRAALRDLFTVDETRQFIDFLDRLEAFFQAPVDPLIAPGESA